MILFVFLFSSIGISTYLATKKEIESTIDCFTVSFFAKWENDWRNFPFHWQFQLSFFFSLFTAKSIHFPFIRTSALPQYLHMHCACPPPLYVGDSMINYVTESAPRAASAFSVWVPSNVPPPLPWMAHRCLASVSMNYRVACRRTKKRSRIERNVSSGSGRCYFCYCCWLGAYSASTAAHKH